MHELGIAQEIVSLAKSYLPDGKSRVSSVTVRAGKFAAVDPESLEFAFGIACGEEESMRGAALVFREEAGRLDCRRCGACLPLEELAVSCPECGGSDIDVSGMDALVLESIEIKEED